MLVNPSSIHSTVSTGTSQSSAQSTIRRGSSPKSSRIRSRWSGCTTSSSRAWLIPTIPWRRETSFKNWNRTNGNRGTDLRKSLQSTSSPVEFKKLAPKMVSLFETWNDWSNHVWLWKWPLTPYFWKIIDSKKWRKQLHIFNTVCQKNHIPVSEYIFSKLLWMCSIIKFY